MDAATTLTIIAAGAAGGWLLLASVLAVARLRAPAHTLEGGWVEDDWPVMIDPGPPAEDDGNHELRASLERDLRGAEREARLATITELGRLAPLHEWAVDCLVEALATGIESPARLAAELDRLVPRPGGRLVPLLGHPSEVVRFYTVRLLARYPSFARDVVDLTADPSPNVRAAALETLRDTCSAEALRCAFALLDDAQPLVRAQAARTATAIGGLRSAPLVAPLVGDASWWVRDTARKSLAGMGDEVAESVAWLLESDDPLLRRGGALVLGDVGALDPPAHTDDGARAAGTAPAYRLEPAR